MEVIWKARALKEREEIHARLAQTSIAHAHATIAAIQRAVDHLEHHPRLGKQASDKPNNRLLWFRAPTMQSRIVSSRVVPVRA